MFDATVYSCVAARAKQLGCDVLPGPQRAMCDYHAGLFQEWVEKQAKALMHEAVEIMDWTAWKWWSNRVGNKSGVEPGSLQQVDEIRVEIVDALHFLVNLALLTGMSADDLYNAYLEKNKINHERADSGTY